MEAEHANLHYVHIRLVMLLLSCRNSSTSAPEWLPICEGRLISSWKRQFAVKQNTSSSPIGRHQSISMQELSKTAWDITMSGCMPQPRIPAAGVQTILAGLYV